MPRAAPSSYPDHLQVGNEGRRVPRIENALLHFDFQRRATKDFGAPQERAQGPLFLTVEGLFSDPIFWQDAIHRTE